MIGSVTIENFRVFKEKTSFLFRPFTVLTGPNNSGKSSLIKFLLLIREGLESLNFEKGNHNLEGYNEVLNWNSQSEKIKFSYNEVWDDEIKVEFDYNNSGKLTRLKYFSNTELVFDIFNYLPSGQDDEGSQTLKLNLEKLFPILLKEKILFYNVFILGEEMTDTYENEIIEFQNNYFKSITTNFSNVYTQSGPKDVYEAIKDLVHYMIVTNKNKLIEFLSEELKFDKKNIAVEYSKFGEDFFEEKIWTDNDSGEEQKFIKLKRLVNNMLQRCRTTLFKDIHYLSANRGSQQRVLKNKSENDIDEVVLEFTKTKIKDVEFLQKCFDIIGIEGKLKVNRYENVISTLSLKKDDRNISFADLGYGYSQILPIILKCHNMIESTHPLLFFFQPKILILEEPEANLHPSLQSKLADLLMFIQKKVGIQFIIETHSEYFIRKLQYLTAKKKVNIEDAVIYYFNDDKYVTKTEPKVKEIFINEDGGLTDSFGPGFFDEATKLQFDLIKLNKQQMN